MAAALEAYKALSESDSPRRAQRAISAAMGMRCRAMFKMDFAEALYIAELRSDRRHFSYRRVAWEMYRAIVARHPRSRACSGLRNVKNIRWIC